MNAKAVPWLAILHGRPVRHEYAVALIEAEAALPVLTEEQQDALAEVVAHVREGG